MSQPGVSRDAFLEAAAGIGRALCRQAYWDREGRLCNWVGRSILEAARPGDPITPVAAALGPDLYGGSAGVALFLAQLADVTGDGDCRRTALGAIARSIRQAGRLPPGGVRPLSFHGGLVGIAYAAHRIAALTGEHALNNQVETFLTTTATALAEPHVLDVMGGNAGAIPALLALGRVERWRHARTLAVSLGDELCRTAVPRGSGWVWDVEKACGPGMGGVQLTGFAHGAAGLGLALLELHAATGRDEFLEGGRAAFAYEDELFNPAVGNWPDLRSPGPAGGGTPAAQYAAAWCHGAPGVGLARLRALLLDPASREEYVATARTALSTTMGTLEGAAQLPRADATLCHGLAGLAEIVLTAGYWLDDEGYRDAAGAAAAGLIAKYGVRGDWPSGVPSRGPNPSLMLGTAGIGYHFLRQHDPHRVPPVLVVVA